MFPRGRELILGIGGGISAYKSADLLRRLQEIGFLITVIPTRSSQNFVGSATWAALSGRPVHDDLWSDVHSVPHIHLASRADAIVIAPTTADLISRLAQGRADDLLTNVVLASKAPLILVPAMHPEMWLHPATVANVETLRSRGVQVVEPDTGRLTGSDSGVGRYPETQKIISALTATLKMRTDMAGIKVLVTAGGTREPIDPVRYIGNRSSGKQGVAVAFAAARRGAEVTLVCANINQAETAEIEGVRTIHVETALEMYEAVKQNFDEAAIVVMTAAVADAKPLHPSQSKFDKNSFTQIELTPTIDILAEIGPKKGNRVVVGFAAQADEDRSFQSAIEKAEEKYRRKNLDFIYVNDVSNGAIFGSENTSGSIIGETGEVESVDSIPKLTLADKLLDLALNKLSLGND